MSDPDPIVLADLLRDALRRGQEPLLTVTSDSMAPLLRLGDQIHVGPVTADQLRPGDIIVIGGRTALLTHRYWGRIGDEAEVLLLTRGDRTRDSDPPAPVGQLVGRVVARQRAQQVLPLGKGIGRWLNARLATLAALDARYSAAPRAPGADSGSSPKPGTRRGRLARRTLRGVASILARSVDLVGASGRSQGSVPRRRR